ncbi:MAG: hypothetical protein QXI96_02120 [Thermofilum sp.]
MKLAAYVIKGASCSDIMSRLRGTLTVGKSFLLATIDEYAVIFLRVEFRDLNNHCKLVYVNVSPAGARMWREVFTVCCEESEKVMLVLRRVRGVGRVGADVIGHRLLEFLKSSNVDIEVLESNFF